MQPWMQLAFWIAVAVAGIGAVWSVLHPRRAGEPISGLRRVVIALQSVVLVVMIVLLVALIRTT